jgi:PAS domain S-box-containing protein
MCRVFILSLSCILLFLSTEVAYSQQTHKSHVLVLNSYHKGLSWTDDIIKGIETVLKNGSGEIDLHMEFMDTKRFFDDRYFQLLAETYKEKYGKIALDVVIAVDNDAFDFVRQHYEELFSGKPVVFCGVNNFHHAMLDGHNRFTGVVEETDLTSTIELSLKLHPKTEQIAVISDRTTTGVAMKNELLEVASYFGGSVKFVFLENLNMSELQERIKELPPKSVILLTVFNYDKSGQFFTYEESLARIYPHAKVPIYSIWDFYLGGGIVGGLLTSGFQQGKAAGELSLRILRGEDAGKIPVIRRSPNRYMFDDLELRRFSIRHSSLPEDRLIINLPDTFYSRHKELIFISVGMFIFLSAIIFILVFNIALRKRTETALRESERKYRDLYDNAPDMYHSVDKEGVIIDCNETEARILGYAKAEIIGRPITDFMTEQSRTIQEEEFPAIIKMSTIQGLEREFVKKDGNTFTANMNVFNETDGAGELIKTRTIGRDVSERIRVEAELKQSREDLRNLSAHIESAREQERGHIAREVHDELGVTLSKLKLDIAWLEKRLSDNRLLLDKTKTMFELVDDTIRSVQKIASELRPGVLDHLGLSAAIKWQAGEFRDRAGIQCVLSLLPEDIELDHDLSIAIFRIFQETLSNVVRHAEATKVEVDLLEADGILTLDVRDNGKGITDEQISNPTSFGLMGIRERVGFLGGSLEIRGVPGEGTIVSVCIPLPEPVKQG